MLDLVGIKVLCPYKVDADEVANYLFAQTDRVRVIEHDPQQGWRDDPRGYRGYNFTVYPAVGRRYELSGLCCEVQIKTLIQEAWDAMTHDLTYKRADAIPEVFMNGFAALNDTLKGAEGVGEIFRTQVEGYFAEFIKHRHAAAQRFFGDAVPQLQILRTKYPDLAIPELTHGALPDETAFTSESIAAINEALRREQQEGGVDRNHCRVATLVALCSRAPGQVAYAVRLVNDLLMISPSTARDEMLRASVLWALGRFAGAVESAERAMKKPERRPGSNDENDFCYFVSDAEVFHAFVPTAAKAMALEMATRLAEGDPPSRDTAGFTLIVLGRDHAAVRDGMSLVEAAYSDALGGDDRTQALAQAFCDRHLKLGQQRLDGKAWW